MPAVVIIKTDVDRTRAAHWCKRLETDSTVYFYPPGRTKPQNSKMWACLNDIAQQAEHNGKRYTSPQWKELFMHACGHEVQFMEGLNNEPFPRGFSSSSLSKEAMNDLITFIVQWGDEHGIEWKEYAKHEKTP